MSPHLTLVSVLLASCAEQAVQPPPEPEPEPPPVVTALRLQQLPGGDAQAAVAGTSLPRPIQVRVTRNGSPVGGQAVTWVTTSGSLSLQSTYTDGSGYATAHWTLGDTDGLATAKATIPDEPSQVVEFRATVWPRVDAQTAGEPLAGEVGVALEAPLRVRVSPRRGQLQAGIPVDWIVNQGSVTPSRSYTDQQGIASTTWVLGGTAGVQEARAVVRGHLEGPIPIEASARPGPPVELQVWGGFDSRGANLRFTEDWLRAKVSDRFGNVTQAVPAAWQVLSGPGELTALAGQDLSSTSAARLRPVGIPGVVVVRTTVGTTGLSRDFTFTFTEPTNEVHLVNGTFLSPMNGTLPAIDTIPVGSTLRWVLTPFDYEDHTVTSVGTPSFERRVFPYGSQASVSVTFVAPGTYQYRDEDSAATGTVVVQ